MLCGECTDADVAFHKKGARANGELGERLLLLRSGCTLFSRVMGHFSSQLRGCAPSYGHHCPIRSCWRSALVALAGLASPRHDPRHQVFVQARATMRRQHTHCRQSTLSKVNRYRVTEFIDRGLLGGRPGGPSYCHSLLPESRSTSRPSRPPTKSPEQPGQAELSEHSVAPRGPP